MGGDTALGRRFEEDRDAEELVELGGRRMRQEPEEPGREIWRERGGGGR